MRGRGGRPGPTLRAHLPLSSALSYSFLADLGGREQGRGSAPRFHGGAPDWDRLEGKKYVNSQRCFGIGGAAAMAFGALHVAGY